MNNPAIRAEHLIKTYHPKTVINDINLTFSAGERVGIIGTNGAGKSTLLSMIAGITSPTSGILEVAGKVTAVMTLGVGLREEMTGRENIYLDGELQGKTRREIEQVIDEIITFSELETFIDRPLKTYSTGMKSRLAFSMLVCIEPEILIIDEALSAGDVFFAEKAALKIREICQKGKIVIIVSHSMSAITTMCNRCIWLENGKIYQDGKPAEVTRNYLQKVNSQDSQHCDPVPAKITAISHSICQIKFLRCNNDLPFYTGEKFQLDIGITHEGRPTQLVFAIERGDGLLISEQSFEFNYPANTTTIVELSLDYLCLNRGIYQIKLMLYASDELTCTANKTIQIKNSQVASGGVALLQYPTEITLLNEDSKSCLALAALITD